MFSAPSSVSATPAILVISCSDARLTRENAELTWKKRLNFSGDIFEFKCPGGGVAMADTKSSFYRSAFDSFRLLSGLRSISQVVLAFHEQCAYVSDKYGSGAASEMETLKWRLAHEAVDHVSGWAEGLRVRPLYVRFMSSRESGNRTRETLGASDESQIQSCDHLQPHYHSERPQVALGKGGIFVPSDRATLTSFERQVEERLLQTHETIDQVIALAERQARETGTTPAWRIEVRAREFVDLLRRRGRTSTSELRKLVTAFVQNYAGETTPRGVQRSILTELDKYLQSLQPGK